MKMRSILLSVLAIAVLAGCAKNNELPGDPDVNAKEAVVTLRLKGNGSTRAAGVPGDLDTKNSTVNDLTVFFFDGDALVNKVYQATVTGSTVMDVKTTTSAKQAVVVANIGSDQTTTGIFASVTSRTTFMAATANLLKDGNPVQNDEKVYMSGEGTITYDATGKEGSVTIPLNFVAARIDLKVIDFSGAIGKGSVYGTHFSVASIYLMRAQRWTNFLPTGADESLKYISKENRKFAGGVTWESTTTTVPADYRVHEEYRVTTIPGALTANKMEDLGHWYVFDNNELDEPTVLVVKVNWKKNGTTDTPLFFNVTFNGNDQMRIRSGNTYQVNLKLNGNFKPGDDGGTGGGGEGDPDTPTVDAAVDITVTPATWTPNLIEKEWN